jgi:hypothetical protein
MYVVSSVLDNPWDIPSYAGAVGLRAVSYCRVRSSLGCSTLRHVLSIHEAVQHPADHFVGIVPCAENFSPVIERGSV